MERKYPHLSHAANLRLSIYDRFDLPNRYLKANEDRINAVAEFISRTQFGKGSWIAIPYLGNIAVIKIVLKKDMRMMEHVGPILEGIEEHFGPVKSTNDQTDNSYLVGRRFYFDGLELLVEIEAGNEHCRLVPTGETEVIQKMKVVCG